MSDESVIVLKTPKTCNECKLSYGLVGWHCILTGKSVNLMKKPKWCPLRDLPEKDTKSYFPDEFEDGYAAGWNGCIDEITGGSSDD